MSASEVPVAATLSARVIRACTAHAQCPLACPERQVEELGMIASFDHRVSMMHTLKENYLRWRHSVRTPEKQ